MLRHIVVLCGLCAAVAGCAAPPPTQTQSVVGYRYHDANHYNEVVAPSPQAIENAGHGVWLWPPASTARPG